MKNNKGFATTFILFSLLVLFLIIMAVLMSTLSNSSTLTSNLRNKLTDNVESPNIYKEYNFAATGDMQIFTAPASKVYTVEGWSTSNKYLKTSKYLEKNQQLYLYVGTSSYNGGNTDVRTVYGTVNDAISRASIILDVNANGAVNTSKPNPDSGNGYVKIKYSSLTANNIGYNNGNTHISCKNVQCALDKLNRTLNNNDYICERATQEQLHAGYGQVGTTGQLKSGDAFVCDVDGDGDFNSNSELFYYVSDYFDTTTKSFDSNYAALIYFNNVSSGSPDNSATAKYHDFVPISGPDTAKKQLPTTEQWKNILLYKDKRAILGEYKTTHNAAANGTATFPTDYSYTGYAARLLTAQELMRGCGLSQVGNYNTDELSNCNYLVENIMTSPGQTPKGYWLETPSVEENRYYLFVVTGYDRFVNTRTNSSAFGVRPVIDVNKKNIKY